MVSVIKEINGELLAEYEWEHTQHEQPRRFSEILDAESLLCKQVWYNRHCNLRSRIEDSSVRLVTQTEFTRLSGHHPESSSTLYGSVRYGPQRTRRARSA